MKPLRTQTIAEIRAHIDRRRADVDGRTQPSSTSPIAGETGTRIPRSCQSSPPPDEDIEQRPYRLNKVAAQYNADMTGHARSTADPLSESPTPD